MAEILTQMQHDLTRLEVIPSRGGVFEVSVDGDLLFSKKASGRHAEPGEIMSLIRARA